MRNGIPVLMYHSLEGNKNDISVNNKSTTIALEDFETQMALLNEMGYETISIDQLLNGSLSNSKKKQVVITFDDAFYTTLKDAAPVLEKYNYTATLFLPIGPVNKGSFFDFQGFAGIKNDRPLTWDEVMQLDKAGWSIQSHGINHPRMSELKMNQIEEELLHSKNILETKLKKEVKYFAYPFGDYDRRVLKTIATAGYQAAFTVHLGKTVTNANPFRLRRIEINNRDTAASFISKIETGYESSNEKWRSIFRDFLYASPAVKDLLRSLKK